MFTSRRSLFGSERGTTTSWLAGITAAALIVGTVALPAVAVDGDTPEGTTLSETTEPAALEAPAEQPAVEEPAVEEPAAEEPAVEEALIDEPLEEVAPAEEPVADESVAEAPASPSPQKSTKKAAETKIVVEAAPTGGTPKIDLDQCRNGTAASPSNCTAFEGGSQGWVNGNVGNSQAHMVEGYSTPFRAVMNDVPTGTPITLVIGYDIKHSSAHAYDYLTSYDRLEPHTYFDHGAEDVQPTSGVTGLSATTDTYPIPAPSSAGSPVTNQPTNNFNSLPGDERQMTLFGGDITNIAYVTQGSLTDSQSETRIAVTFELESSTAVLAWGGHIALCYVWGVDADGKCRSAGGISGSPYHMRLIEWFNGEELPNLGNTDRSMAASVVVPPGSLILAKTLTGGPAGYTGPFPINYTCGPEFSGTVQVSAGSSVTVNGLPPGVMCTVSETLPTPPTGYEFGTPTYTPSNTVEIVPGASVSVTTNNTLNKLQYELSVTKTANGTYNRYITWELKKRVDPASHSGAAGDSFESTWTVEATKTVGAPTDFAVTGTIEISNPSPFDAPFSVSDVLSDGTEAEVACPVSTVPAGETIECTYSAEPSTGSAETNTVTVTPDSQWFPNEATATVDVDWEGSFVGDDEVTLTDPRFDEERTLSDSATVTFDETFECPADEGAYDNGSYSDTETNTAYLDGANTDLEASAQVQVDCSLIPIVATKTADGAYTQPVTWALKKTVNDDSHSGAAGQLAGTSKWTVQATRNVGSKTGFTVTGTISVFNPSAITRSFTVTDKLSDGTIASVSCPAASVPAGQTVVCSYTAEPVDDSATQNEATVTLTGNPPQTATAEIEWSGSLTGDQTVVLSDPRWGSDTWTINTSTTLERNEDFRCSADEDDYTNGAYSYNAVNTAYLVGDNTNLSASADVDVDCTLAPLDVDKTADASYKQDITWSLEKSVSPASHSGAAGDSFGSTWTVTATKSIGGEYDHKVTGTITVHNPTAITRTFTVSDVMDDDTVAAVTCPATTVAAGQSVICTYSASPLDSSAEVNTATVTMPGNANQTATAAVDWQGSLVGDESVTLADERFDFSEELSDSDTITFDEVFECSADEADYTDGGYSYTETNTATLFGEDTDLDASADVDVVCALDPVVATKTAAGAYTQDITWELTKTVDDASHSGDAGQTAGDSTWTVEATKVIGPKEAFEVTGTISVYNPSTITRNFTVTDELSDGTEATVTCPKYTVATEETVLCTYTASPADDGADQNKATVTVAGNPPQTATAAIEWTGSRLGDEKVTLADDRFDFSEELSDSYSKTFDEVFECSADESMYEDGSYSYTATNTATLLGEVTDLEASADVDVNCTLEPLAATKTAEASYQRDISWELTKSVAPASHTGDAGDSFDSEWSVVATKTESDPYDHVVTGSITVSNPTAITRTFTVTDVLDDGTEATVTCPALEIPAGGSIECSYTANPADATATLNTATVKMGGFSDPITATADVVWDEQRNGDDTVTLADERLDYSESISSTTTLNEPETFFCSSNEGDYTNGAYLYTETNTATLTGDDTNLEASADVDVDCTLEPLAAVKTAAGAFNQDLSWTLVKAAAPTVHEGEAGGTFGSTWTVTATKTVGAPYGHTVTGSITVSNPTAIARTFTVVDVLDDDTEATVTCPALEIPAGGSVECTYTANPADATATLNTATITMGGFTEPITATAEVAWTGTRIGDEAVQLTDPKFGLDQEISESTTVTFPETFACSSEVTDYTNGVYSYTVPNTAFLDGAVTDLEASAQVDVTCRVRIPTLDKTSAIEDGGPTVEPTDVINYTVTVGNTGGLPLTGPAVDNLPDGLTVVAGSVSGDGVVSNNGQTITWQVVDLAPGATLTFTYDAVVGEGVVDGQDLINVVTFLDLEDTTTTPVELPPVEPVEEEEPPVDEIEEELADTGADRVGTVVTTALLSMLAGGLMITFGRRRRNVG